MISPHQQALVSRTQATRAAARGRFAVAMALFAVLLSSSAYGADYSAPPPDLPDFALRGSDTPVIGPPTYPRWDGFYFGAQAGRTFGSADFSNGSSSLISYILANSELQDTVSNWTTLPKSTTASQSYGGFIGYNIQWGEVITGIELNYNHMALNAGAQDSAGPLVVPGAPLANGSTVQYAITVASKASVAISDIMTARARAGWTFDRLMPYGFVGLAVGRADITHSASVTGTKTTTTQPIFDPITGALIVGPISSTANLTLPRNPQSESKSQIAYGVSAGLGVEIGILPNVFLRGEWEYVSFANISDVRVQTNTVRAGIGLKF